MKVGIATRRLAKVLSSEREMNRQFGRQMSKALAGRLAVLRNAPNLVAVPTRKPERRHALKGQRTGQHTVDLVHGYRLVFTAAHAPLPERPGGGLDEEQVTAITIVDVVDYH